MLWFFLTFYGLLYDVSADITRHTTLLPESENTISLKNSVLQSECRELDGSLCKKENADYIMERPTISNNFTGKSSDSESSWFVDIPVLSVAFTTSATLPDGDCKKQVHRYMRDLRRGKLWAVQMFDASAKYPDGIIYGHTKSLGQFDQCYELQTSLPSDEDGSEAEEVNGRYCLVTIAYRPMHTGSISGQYKLRFDPNGSAWEAVTEKGDFRRLKRYILHMAICVPATCSRADVEAALKEPLEQLGADKDVHLNISVKPEHCQSRIDTPKFSTGATIYCYMLLGLLVLIVLSTWYDISLYEPVSEQHTSYRDFLLCFSARRNLKSLCNVQQNHPGLDTMHLLRFFSMSLVIFGHRILQYCNFPSIDAMFVEEMYPHRLSMVIFNGPLITDGFLGLGGLLMSYFLCMELEITKRVHFIAHIAIRFLRLTPTYMLVVFFNAYVLIHLGSGPYWETKIGFERDRCAVNWWTNLLYINNYVNNDKLCMLQSWYLSVDFHMYIIALFVVYAFWQMPRRLGYLFLGSLIVVSSFIPFIITYVNNADPILPINLNQREIREDPYFMNFYTKTHMRAAPYMVGVLAGVIVYDYRGATWKLPKAWSRILFLLLAVGLSITSQNLAYKYSDPNYERKPLDSALYAALHRPAFALSYCAIVVLITIGDGLDFHRNFLTPSWAAPLARLTYSAFLLHNVNQSYDIGITRAPKGFTIRNLLWDFVPDIVYSFAASLALHIAVEGPFRKLEKLFLMKRTKRNPDKTALGENDIKKMD